MTPKPVLWKIFDDTIAMRIRPLLKGFGFKQKGLVWNRKRKNFVDVIEIEISKKTSLPDCIDFTIYTGVFVPEADELVWGKRKNTIVRERECLVRVRPTRLNIDHERSQGNDWWKISSEEELMEIFDEIEGIIRNKSIPFLEHFDSPQNIEQFRLDPKDLFFKDWATKIQLAALQVLNGHVSDGKTILQYIVDTKNGWTLKAVEVAERLGLKLEGVPESGFNYDLEKDFHKLVEAKIQALLRGCGFVREQKYGSLYKIVWTRKRKEFVDIVQLDLGSMNNALRVKFALQAGIFLPDAAGALESREKEQPIRDNEWLIRTNARQIQSENFEDTEPEKWWNIDTQEAVAPAAKEVEAILKETFIPFFDQFDTLQKFLDFILLKKDLYKMDPFTQIQLAMLQISLEKVSEGQKMLKDVVREEKAWLAAAQEIIQEHSMDQFFDDVARCKMDDCEELKRKILKITIYLGLDPREYIEES